MSTVQSLHPVLARPVNIATNQFLFQLILFPNKEINCNHFGIGLHPKDNGTLYLLCRNPTGLSKQQSVSLF